jgi:hypothetical protein
MRPLAIAVVGGLAVSSLLTFFVVPSCYVILHSARIDFVTELPVARNSRVAVNIDIPSRRLGRRLGDEATLPLTGAAAARHPVS